MRFLKELSRTIAAISLGLMAACGGGGGGGNGNNGGSSNDPPAPTFRAEAGVAQKGPLINGSTVTVQELDSALSPTGRQFSYQVTSDLGTFSPTSTFNSPYLGVNATGYYFDEVLGAVSAGPVTLNSYNDLSADSTLNVNLLTTLAYQRVKNLMTNGGLTFAAARAQAEGEVLKALNVPMGSYGAFGTLDLKGSGDGDRLLAAVSGLFVNGNRAGTLSTLINNFQSDLGANGTLTNAATKAALAASARTLNPTVVAANLTSRYASLGVSLSAADLAPWIDSDGDGVIEKFAFRVPDASPATLFTLPAAIVNNLVGKSIAATGGQLSVNGTPISGSTTIAANDVVAVSSGVGSFPNGVLTVYLVSQNQRMMSVSFVSGLVSIDVAPTMASIAKGVSQQFTATGHFSDNSTADLTQTVSWSSSNEAVATIGAGGLARSIALGSTTISATSGSIVGRETLTVTAAQLESFTITPSPLRSGVGLTVQLRATGTYTDATKADVTSLATWASNDPAIATINAQTGLATGVSLGTTAIDATIGALTQRAPIAIVTNQFTAGPQPPVAFAYHTATLLPDGRVVVIGGATPRTNTPARVAIYDPAVQSWSQGASNDIARYGHTATLLPNGKILVAGGAGGYDDATASTSDADLYDPATNHWSSAPDMARQRYRAAATLLSDGRVLMTGGEERYIRHNSVQLYDPVTNSWSTRASMADPRAHHTLTVLANGKVLVTGGGSNNERGATAELYDPATDTWSPTGWMTAPERHGHSATLLQDGRVLVAAGSTLDRLTSYNEIYDPVTNTWTKTGPLMFRRMSHTATLMPDGKVLVAGGEGKCVIYVDWELCGSTELYDPATNTWSAGPPLTNPRSGHTATTLPNNVILLIGGSIQHPALSIDMYW